MSKGSPYRGLDDRTRAFYRGQGNYLGKQRRNFYVTNRAWEMMHELSIDIGLSHSGIVELAVRDMYVRYHGSVPPITYVGGGKPE